MKYKWPNLNEPPKRISQEKLQHLIYEADLGESREEKDLHYARRMSLLAHIDRHLEAVSSVSLEIRNNACRLGKDINCSGIIKDDKGILLFGSDSSLLSAYMCLEYRFSLVSDSKVFVYPIERGGQWYMTLGSDTRAGYFIEPHDNLLDSERESQNVLTLTYRPDAYKPKGPITHIVLLEKPATDSYDQTDLEPSDLAFYISPAEFLQKLKDFDPKMGNDPLVRTITNSAYSPIICHYFKRLGSRGHDINDMVERSIRKWNIQ